MTLVEQDLLTLLEYEFALVTLVEQDLLTLLEHMSSPW